MLKLHLIEGGLWWMLPIYIMWIAVLVLSVIVTYKMFHNRKSPTLKPIYDLILFIGSFAFLFGLLGQVMGIMQMMDCIGEIGGISPALIAKGFNVTMLTTTYGFMLFIVSYTIWFIAKRINIS
ncbi:MAG: MotA/TolQ/ExbB proton channel family protein [Bacteroidales bacterium]